MSGTPSKSAPAPAGGRGSGPQVKVEGGATRLTSLRSTDATASGAARKPKFIPRVQKRSQPGDSESAAAKPAKPTFQPRGSTSGEFGSRGERGDRGGRGGRGGRGFDGRGRAGGRGSNRSVNLPAPKVAFVGSMAAGSSVSSGGNVAKAKKPQSTEVGISLLEDGMEAVQVEELDEPTQWPPVVESPMQPMELPFGRPHRHNGDAGGDVFCDDTGAFVAANDTLFFVQLPTTLPYASPAAAPADGKDGATEIKAPNHGADDLFDKSLLSMPGGYLGKINIHKSGKAVLVLGDKTFELAAGQPPACYEEVVSIDVKDKLFSMLGPIATHLVVTPDFESLLQ
ncbi:hypothetical protein H310_13095 [Aphanomyces invadans]|uniref:DNA-directed RNA polymerase III subunit RPC4 n=1 Tax=Aphanomyces invadans TaxID=157072 RepID=A0A024TER0_9STRA|nr:hypothetical protein H310_13095 [Aphanomyces invadans]ETV92650.1 hypothetical protein H310_13095 [Aphanomyces invadans]|eukprot:XP_008878686.1 hypothetical protein H310_13095 [Aphanomyces invadans]